MLHACQIGLTTNSNAAFSCMRSVRLYPAPLIPCAPLIGCVHHVQCEFPVIYASGFQGIAGNSPKEMASDMEPLFQVGGVHVHVTKLLLLHVSSKSRQQSLDCGLMCGLLSSWGQHS
jgi:hypothetical protein